MRPATETTMEGQVGTLTFWQPTHPISTNKANALHWAKRTRELTPWRDTAYVVARQGLLGPWRNLVHGGPVNIQVRLEFRTRTRRDPHNYVGTVVKSIVDGLVRAGVIPDDTVEWATIMDPELAHQPDKAEPLRATVTITPRSIT